jgi:hypothetical protein
MNKDNASSFASFIAQGGHDYDGEVFRSIRIFGLLDDALDYARGLVNKEGYDSAYVSGVYADGSVELKNVIRIADEEPSLVNLG